MKKHFPSSLTLRIDWSEMDEFRHVNNVMFMKYIQSGRVNYWQLTGIYDLFLKERKGFMVLSVSCRFISPLYFPGEVTIETGLIEMGNSSLKLKHVLRNNTQQIVAEAEDVLVMYNFNENSKMNIPEELRNRINTIEEDQLQHPNGI